MKLCLAPCAHSPPSSSTSPSPRRTLPPFARPALAAATSQLLPDSVRCNLNSISHESSQRSAFDAKMALQHAPGDTPRTAAQRRSPPKPCTSLQPHKLPYGERVEYPLDYCSTIRQPQPLSCSPTTALPEPATSAMPSSSRSASSFNDSSSEGYSPPSATHSPPRSRQPRKRGELRAAPLNILCVDDFASL